MASVPTLSVTALDEPTCPTAKRSPLPRRCIATRQRQHRNGMLRFVVGPDGIVTPDLAEKLPGRGLWVSANARTLEKAIERNLFARAARIPALVPEDMTAQVAELLRQRCLQWLGLCHGAGVVRIGFYQVREALERQPIAALVVAADGKENGRAKVLARAGDLPVVTCFIRAELGGALGREQTVHLALAPSKLSTRFMADSRRYAGMMGLDHPERAGSS